MKLRLLTPIFALLTLVFFACGDLNHYGTQAYDIDPSDYDKDCRKEGVEEVGTYGFIYPENDWTPVNVESLYPCLNEECERGVYQADPVLEVEVEDYERNQAELGSSFEVGLRRVVDGEPADEPIARRGFVPADGGSGDKEMEILDYEGLDKGPFELFAEAEASNDHFVRLEVSANVKYIAAECME